MFRDRLLKQLASFNLNEAVSLSNEIFAHKKFEDKGPLLSLEEEDLWNDLELLIEQYKLYH